MSEWVYFIHPPREDFIATITEAESATMQAHFAHLAELHAAGVLILAGPTYGRDNVGITIIEADDEAAAAALVAADPAVTSGLMRPELREMRVSLLRGRDE